MNLVKCDLFGERDLVAIAVTRLREYEQHALKMHPSGYYVAFSGGKDSQVILDLVQQAGVQFTAHMNICGGLDSPELLTFVRDHYPSSLVGNRSRSLGLVDGRKPQPKADTATCAMFE